MGLVRWSAQYLQSKGVQGGRLEAEHLLAHVLGVERLQLYLQFDRPLLPTELAGFKPLLKRRAAREPLQYILGTAIFRTIELQVDPRVLVPRPETEFLIDVVEELAGAAHVFDAAVDVGTGSGAIALALAVEGRARSVAATDVSAAALEVARANATRLELRGDVDFRMGSILAPVADRSFDLILSNPPYLTPVEWDETEPEVRDHEPRSALVSGPDGLDAIRELAVAVPACLRPGGWLGIEVGSTQAGRVAELLGGCGAFAEILVRKDLSGRSRYVLARADLLHERN